MTEDLTHGVTDGPGSETAGVNGEAYTSGAKVAPRSLGPVVGFSLYLLVKSHL